jgi:hypothetical protein
MKRNVASQSIGVEMITAADGTAFTGAVTVLITIDNGTQSASGGTAPAHEGNGYHSYTPTQAETNGDHVAFTFTGTGAIPATVQVYTAFPQTVDNATNIASILTDTGATIPATIADLPTVAEFNARTLLAASYFDPATDAVANVTLVATTTTNTDMRGTDSANTVVPPSVAQFDARTILAANYFDPAVDVVASVTLVATTTTNTDMRGTDSALLAASINLTGGAVDNVTLVATTTTNTDMRGTDSALLASGYTAPDNAGITANGSAIASLNDFNPATDTVVSVTTTANVTNEVNANISKINTVTITGDGSGTPFDV